MKKIREMIEDVRFFTAATLLVLGMCALYWLSRLAGIDLSEDF